MTKTQRKTKKIKSIETKDDGDRDEYSRQQQEYQEGDISSDLDYKPAAASEPLYTHQTDIEMTMPTIQNQQQGTPEEESALPMIHRADSYGRIPAPHENDV